MTPPGPLRRRRAALLLPLVAFCLVLALVALGACATGRSGGDVPGNLLQGKAPSRAVDVSDPERLTDGVAAVEGDGWESDITSALRTPDAVVEWDLGRVAPIRAAYLQGDNNDEFFLSGSEDGQTFQPLWTARSVRGAGMRVRAEGALDARARYLRLNARGGDRAVSASEVLVFETRPDPFPPKIKTLRGQRPVFPGEREALALGVVVSLALLFHSTRGPRWLLGLSVWAPPVVALFTWMAVDVPSPDPVIHALRAVSAAVAAAAVLRLAWKPDDVLPRFVTGWLAAAAVLAMVTFYNMGEEQFEHQERNGRTWVHTWDMRVYFPTAKYFDELGFDGLYLASVAAYLEDVPGASERRVAAVELRDLRNYEMTTVERVIDGVRTVKQRFSAERWQEFKTDMSFFWKAMGPSGYLGSLRDHGGNATPAWLLIAWVLFHNAPATETVLNMAGLLDPLLLTGFFVAVLRTFGLRTAFVCIVVYGTSTFPWFGSNWAGSTLRNDWMVAVGLGACALKAERWVLGGILLGFGAMMRAFPAMAVFFLPVPALWWLYEAKKRDGSFPPLSRILEVQRPLLKVLAGAALCVAVLGISSGALFGFRESWSEWKHKISMHSTKPNVNHVGLRAVIQYSPDKSLRGLSRGGGDWSVEQVKTYNARRPLYFVAIALVTLLTIAVARGRDLRQAALLGMMLIPIFFYPSNYYLHYVFVLPLLVDHGEGERKRWLWGLVSAILLAVCVSEYWGFDARGVDERYVQWSVGALVGFLAILLLLERDGKTPEAVRPGDAVPEEARPEEARPGEEPSLEPKAEEPPPSAPGGPAAPAAAG